VNPFNIAKSYLDDLDNAAKKADKDALKAQLPALSEEMQKFDTSGLDEFGRHFVSDVATRLAAALEAK
jgi:hypothetical protein